MEQALIESMWAGPTLWAVAYVSDYYLTLTCARLYRAQSTVVFEGSYELTPAFQADVDAGTRFSTRFLLTLFVSTVYLVLVQRLVAQAGETWGGLYLLALGAMLGLQCSIHIRHLRNWYLFRHGMGWLTGNLHYGRGYILRGSSLELGLFGALYGILFALTNSEFLLGSAAACVGLSLRHLRLARQLPAPSPRAA